MIPNEIREFERHVTDMMVEILSKSSLDKVGLTVKIGNIKVLNELCYESEVNIDFYDSNGLFDVLEFYIYKDGSKAASLDEIHEWLIESVGDVIKHKQSSETKTP